MSGFREKLFSARGYTPIPFLCVALAGAHPSNASMLWGALLGVAGELIRLWGVAYAGSLTRVTGSVGAPEIVMAGPFAHVRNPLYIGNMILYTGVGIMSFAFWPWLPVAGLIWFGIQYYLIVTLEEEFLEKEFGAVFLEFRRNVPRFIPRLSPYRHPLQVRQSPQWSGAVRSERRTFQAIGLVTVILVAIKVLE